ncbi:MAG: thiamine phosphate synthase [Sulfurovum sp. 28-43-6]|nr:MAG: thiamine phosphate synthase [Sulfurovum sp. 28-43-6]
MMIYALLDKETLLAKDVSLSDFLLHLKTIPNIVMLQYRNKNGSLEEKKSDLLDIRKIYTGKLIINDSIELIDYVDGLHIGQEDIRKYSHEPKVAVRLIREKIGSKLLGLSTHNKEEIVEANELDLNYIGLGAYRSTATKKEAGVLGDSLDQFAKESIHPVAAIGGVKSDDIFEFVTYHVIGSGLL